MQNYVLLFRELVRARVNKGIETECISLLFKAHLLNSVSIYNCVLCFKEIDKDYERFLVKSKKKMMFDVSVAFGNYLDFYIHVVSEYICIVKWGWKAYMTPVRMFAVSISVLLTDLASCLFSLGRWFRGLSAFVACLL